MHGEGAILIVDDDADYSCLLQLALEEARITNRVEVLPDGSAAVAYLEELPSGALPALIFLDLKLPRLSGLEVLRWIRAQPQLNEVPVVLFTGAQDGHDRQQALAVGAGSLRVKPFSYNDLVHEVAAIRDSYLEPREFKHAA